MQFRESIEVLSHHVLQNVVRNPPILDQIIQGAHIAILKEHHYELLCLDHLEELHNVGASLPSYYIIINDIFLH
jgi:hypothetical protein